MPPSSVRDKNLITLASGKELCVEINRPPSSDQAPAIVFMHGLGSSTTFWEATLNDSKLKEHFTLIRFDFDGHGLSPFSGPVTGSNPSLIDLVHDVKDVMEYAGVQRAAGLVGHSMSGLVASHFAAKYPERVEKLVLLGAMKELGGSTKEVMSKRSHAVLESGMSPLVPQIVASALSQHTKETSPLSAALVRALVLSTSCEAYSAACQALAGAVDPDYRAIRSRTLVVAGEEDYMSPRATTDFFADNIAEVEVVTMKKVGHWHAIEQPTELRSIFENFFLAAM